MTDTFSIRIWVYEVKPSGVTYQKLLNELIDEFSAIRTSNSEKESLVTMKIAVFNKFFLRYVDKKHYFNWLPIFQDENNIWTNHRLIELKEQIKTVNSSAWYCICRRTDINWNEELIAQLSKYLDFKALSGNIKVPWTERLIDKWFDKWDWARLSGNKSLPWCHTFIEKYKENWKWIPDNPELAYYCCYKHLQYSYPCISTNSGIVWDIQTFDKYHDKIDYWLLAKTAMLSDDIFLLHHNLFTIKQRCGSKHYRFSDWRRSEKVWETGLEQYPYNENFHLTDKLIEFAKTTKISITKNSEKYDDDMEEVSILLFDIWNKGRK